MESFLKARALSTLIALPIVVLSIWLGSYWFVALISLGGSVASYELSSMAGKINSKTKALLSGFLSGSIILAIGILVSTINIDLFPYSVIAVVVSIFSILWIFFPMPSQNSLLRHILLVVIPALFISLTLSHSFLIRELPSGREWVLLILVVVAMADTFALLIGRSLGRIPLYPSISPSKTWEGTIAALVAAITSAIIFSMIFDMNINIQTSIIMGFLMGTTGQIGDLVESAVKRRAGVKDSGNLMPGHGGAFDRLDSIVFNLPLLYHLIRWMAM